MPEVKIVGGGGIDLGESRPRPCEVSDCAEVQLLHCLERGCN